MGGTASSIALGACCPSKIDAKGAHQLNNLVGATDVRRRRLILWGQVFGPEEHNRKTCCDHDRGSEAVTVVLNKLTKAPPDRRITLCPARNGVNDQALSFG